MSDSTIRSPREQILEAVITCIEKDGIESLTTRRIAEEAGTNIASINYYFRSKDLLVEEALTMTVNHMLDDVVEIMAGPPQPFEAMLEEVLYYMIEGALRFPGMTLAHIHSIIVEKRTDTIAADAFRKIFGMLTGHAERAFGDVPAEQIRAAMAQVLSTALFTMLAPELFLPATPLALSHPDGHRTLARYLTRHLVHSLTIPIQP
jgi:AcrR family transcriptional regulator